MQTSSSPHPLGRRIGLFALAGSLGFIVDACVLLLLADVLHLNVYAARVASFGVAVVVTWLVNRTFVFNRIAVGARRAPGEFARYLAVQGSGAALNFAIFSSLVFLSSELRAMLIVPLGIASGIAMLFNYLLLSAWVYGPRSADKS